MFVPKNEHEKTKLHVLHTAAMMFLEQGYNDSTMREISSRSGIKYGSMRMFYPNKEDILCDLVNFIIEGQFSATEKILRDVEHDKILFYAAETTLQLHIAESSEHIRELYNVCYSLPNSSDIIFHKITGKLENIFREHLPTWETKDFFEKEIASGGIMRNFMSVPCDMYFTMDRKIRAFHESTFLVYEVPREKIEEAIAFVNRYDWAKIAQEVIDDMLAYLAD